MSGLAQRSCAAELMDTEAVPFEEFRQCLQHLEFINRCTLAYRPTLAWLDRLVAATGLGTANPLNILDVGYGHGDMLRRVSSWAKRRNIPVRLAGVDLNPWSARAAALATPAHLSIQYEVGDVFDLPDNQRVDVVLSSLFTHHLADPDLVRFLRWMEVRAKMGWFINDLHRHPLPYQFVRVATRVLPVNRMVRHDAPISVARAFTKRDWAKLLERGGVDPTRVSVDWFFPFRFGVGRIL